MSVMSSLYRWTTRHKQNCSRRKSALWSMFAIMFAWGFPSIVVGAMLSRLQLVVDGSSSPPGDKIHYTVCALPTDKNLTIEVRGFVLAGDPQDHVEPVKGKGTQDRNTAGFLLIQRKVVVPPDANCINDHIVIPYESIDLPVGTHRLGYELTLLVDGKSEVAQATRLTRVIISDQARREIRRATLTYKEVSQSRKRTAFIGAAAKGLENASPLKKDVDLASTDLVPVMKLESLPTNIPGGFRREMIKDQDDLPPTDGDAAQSLEGQPWTPASELREPTERVVYFATNRAPEKPTEPPAPMVSFSATADNEVRFGSCVVNFPVLNHRKGRLEVPTWWVPRNVEQHFSIESLTTLDRSAILQAMSSNDVLVYVHGFNNRFEDAVLRTAQLKYDLEFPGEALAFCWPSAGELGKYEADTQQVAAAAVALADVIEALVGNGNGAESGQGKARRVHIVAHSLGNRILLNAFYQLHQNRRVPSESKPMGQVVLAAPDVGATMFNNLLPYVVERAEQVTYYYCNQDAALNISRKLNLYEPVGLLPFFERDVTTVNADRMDTSFLNHNYFASSAQVLLDIQLMLNERREPEARMPPLVGRSMVLGHEHWSFSPVSAAEVANK